jgi:hypothetical protein
MLTSDRITSCTDDGGLLALPFVKDDPKWRRPGSRGPRCFWAVKTTGDTTADCDLGSTYARAALDHMERTRLSRLLGSIATDMALQPQAYECEDKMIVIGFMSEIARFSRYGWHIAQEARALPNGALTIAREKPEEQEIDGVI